MTERTVVLFGSSGFVGREVARALTGCQLITMPTPRLTSTARTVGDLEDEVQRLEAVVRDLARGLVGADVVVNAAGNPDASSLDEDALFGANALVPALLLAAAKEAGVSRFVHVSSAVVQNDKPTLDSSEDLRPFSPYSASKVLGEEAVRDADASVIQVVRYRPPSVHAPGRRVTRMIGRIASSGLASVAAPGTQATPQALLPNVASAIAFLATTDRPVPTVVHHPSEGVTVTSLMQDLGDREPRVLPVALARAIVRAGKAAGRIHRPTAANARRVELLWLGQAQEPSWLEQAGWEPAVGKEGWRLLRKPRRHEEESALS